MNTNDATRATAEAMPREQATVPYPAQDPINEMDAALGRLRVLYAALTADSQRLIGCSSLDAAMIVNEVLDTFDPIRMFLAENEFPNVSLSFLECRREWFARKGGAKDDVGTQTGELASMIAEHKEVSERVTAYEGGIDDEQIGEHCDNQIRIALAICGYRPLTDADARLKAEFLRDWTRETQLTSEEQKALIASMLPKGGDA